jgi:hypothetical protein
MEIFFQIDTGRNEAMRYRRNKNARKLKKKDREDRKVLTVDIDNSLHLGARLQMRF